MTHLGGDPPPPSPFYRRVSAMRRGLHVTAFAFHSKVQTHALCNAHVAQRALGHLASRRLGVASDAGEHVTTRHVCHADVVYAANVAQARLLLCNRFATERKGAVRVCPCAFAIRRGCFSVSATRRGAGRGWLGKQWVVCTTALGCADGRLRRIDRRFRQVLGQERLRQGVVLS